MCHTLARLSSGRAVLLGGRARDGVCEDAWWFDPVSTAQLGTDARGCCTLAADSLNCTSVCARRILVVMVSISARIQSDALPPVHHPWP